MNTAAGRRLPLSTVTLVFGVLSIPLAFLRHLCSLAVVLAGLALLFSLAGHYLKKRHGAKYSRSSIRNSRAGLYTGAVGMLAGIVMWLLWAGNVLLR